MLSKKVNIMEVNKCKFHTAITVSIYHRDVVLSLQCPRSSDATMTGWWRAFGRPKLHQEANLTSPGAGNA